MYQNIYLKHIYYSIFNSHLIYVCEIWGQDQNSRLFKNLIQLKEKALRIINFKNFNEDANPFFKENQILKISDFMAYKNDLCIRMENLYLFNDMFTLLNTNVGSKNLLDTPSSQSTHYGENSIRVKATSNWNLLQRITNVDLLTNIYL